MVDTAVHALAVMLTVPQYHYCPSTGAGLCARVATLEADLVAGGGLQSYCPAETQGAGSYAVLRVCQHTSRFAARHGSLYL